MKTCELIEPQHGVVTLFGYGISVRVERGHLVLQDGIGESRREARLPRVGHALQRLVVIGADGVLSLAALRWLADQKAALAMLERNGSVLTVTGPARQSDAKLRRSQSLAYGTQTGLQIAREIMRQKLFGQMRVVSQNLHREDICKVIGGYRDAILKAETVPDIRFLEAQAAAEYWSAWQSLPVIFPTKDTKRVPTHWCRFDTRSSLLTNSARLATNPTNAILNYLYALLEVESTLAASAIGLDPCIGFVHVDAPYRDNLACDIMEVGRPTVDSYVIDLVSRPLRKDWFFEERNGNCRLTSSLANQLSKTSRLWARAVAPITEWIAQELDSPPSTQAKRKFRPTLLTHTRKREARGNSAKLPRVIIPKTDSICVRCGNNRTARGEQHCWRCGRAASRKRLLRISANGRIASRSTRGQAKRAESQRKHRIENLTWSNDKLPSWLNEAAFRTKVQPLLRNQTNAAIAKALQVSRGYAAEIRKTRRMPHPRHWEKLAHLAGVRI